jgi:transcription elongation GreA/GreB family factor
MSRAFVKESDGADGEELAELQVSPHRNLVTAEGLAQVEATVGRLRDELARARGDNDRATARRVQRDLRYWTERQRTAELVSSVAPGGKARFGSIVVLESADGSRVEYRIVGEDEADPARGKISYVSPIARRLIGAAAGEEIDLPDGTVVVAGIR